MEEKNIPIEEITISDLDVEKQGFMPVAYFLRKWLDKIYPKDIFKIGTDSGSTFVVNLRKLLNELDEEKVNVESLQNGERDIKERITELMVKFSMSLRKQESLVSARDISNEMKVSEPIIDEVLDLFSQSKKEGENDYEIGFNDGWHTCCRENNIENDARILYLRRKENINRFKESLTNQKKVI